MGRAASKSYFQDSSLHSADISTACWCLSFHLCTTISCPLHQVKKPNNNPTTTIKKKSQRKKTPTCVFSNICCWSEASEGGSDFSAWWESCKPGFQSMLSVGETRFQEAAVWSPSSWVAQRPGSPNIFLQFS